MTGFPRSVVAYWGMPEAEAQALLAGVGVVGVALWPVNTSRELAALWLHLDANREVRIVWALCMPGDHDQEPYTRLLQWHNGADGNESRLPTGRFEAICKWVHPRLAIHTTMAAPGNRSAVVSLGPCADLLAMMQAVEDLMAPREAV